MSRILKIWWITLFIKLLITLYLPLSADETYYWTWSLAPQLGYYDHPPFVAWLFALGRKLEFLNPNTVKFPAVILGHLSLFIWIKIYEEICKTIAKVTEESSHLLAYFVLCLFSPLLGFGSLILTPDLPLIFFWSLSLLFTIKYFQQPSLKVALGIGLSLGLGFLSKYHIVLFIPPLLLWIFFEGKWKKIRILDAAAGIVIGLLVTVPVFWWNFQNDFISFKFQLNHGLGRSDYNIYWTWSFLVGQAILIFPPILWTIFQGKLSGIARVLLYFGFFPILFFLVTSFRGLVEANWPITAYPSLYLAAALSNLRKIWLIIFSAFWSSAYLAVFFLSQVSTQSPGLEKFNELAKMNTLTGEIERFEPLFFDTYQTASLYSWIKQKKYCKLAGASRVDFFDFEMKCKPQENLFYFFANSETNPPEWILKDSAFKFEIIASLSTGDRVFKIERTK